MRRIVGIVNDGTCFVKVRVGLNLSQEWPLVLNRLDVLHCKGGQIRSNIFTFAVLLRGDVCLAGGCIKPDVVFP